MSDVRIFKLKGLNLITGRNGGGKSSLLEALFLNASAGNVHSVIKIAGFRGDNTYVMGDDSIFRSFFKNGNPNNILQVVTEDRIRLKSHTRILSLGAILRSVPMAGTSKPKQAVVGLKVHFKGKSGNRESSLELNFPRPGDRIDLNSNPFKVEPALDHKDLIYAQYISPYMRDNTQETYDQLANAFKSQTITNVLKTVQIVAPHVRGLLPLSEQGAPRIYADIGAEQMLPVSALGSGFMHILRIALAVSQIEDGFLLIDELEDGLHFSIMNKIVEFLISVVKQKRVQFFVATHSDELISAFGRGARQSDFDDMCLINMSAAAERNHVRVFERDDMEYARELNSDLRS